MQILLSVASPGQSPAYMSKVNSFFAGLFAAHEDEPMDDNLRKICATLWRLGKISPGEMEQWLQRLVQAQGERKNL